MVYAAGSCGVGMGGEEGAEEYTLRWPLLGPAPLPFVVGLKLALPFMWPKDVKAMRDDKMELGKSRVTA